MTKIKDSKQEKNSLILVIYIFHLGLLAPLDVFFPTVYNVVIFNMIMGVYFLLLNRKIKLNVIFIFLGVNILFSLNYLMHINIVKLSNLLLIYVQYLTMGFIAYLYGSGYVDYDKMYGYMKKIAWINFFILIINPILGNIYDYSHMGFGYRLLPSIFIFYIELIYYRNHKYAIPTILGSVILLVFGARGTMICLLFLVCILLLNRMHKKKFVGFIIILVFTGVIILITKGNLVTKMLDIADAYDINTYSFNKYRVLLEEGLLASSSGRGIIFRFAIELINEYPIFGVGIGGFKSIANESNLYYLQEAAYTHNIFLDIINDFGLFLIPLIFFLLVYVCIKYTYIKDEKLKIIIWLLISLSIPKLMITSIYWKESSLWIAIALIINYNKHDKNCEV